VFVIVIGSHFGGHHFPLGYFASTYIHDGDRYATGIDDINHANVKKYKYKKSADNSVYRLMGTCNNVSYGNIEEIKE